MNAEVENNVLDMVRDKAFFDFITKKMEEKVHVTSLQAEKNKLRDQLRQAEGSMRKLIEQMDKLDDMDRHHNRKYRDMQDRLDNLYDRSDELEDAIANAAGKMNGRTGKITKKSSVKSCSGMLKYINVCQMQRRSNSSGISSSPSISTPAPHQRTEF